MCVGSALCCAGTMCCSCLCKPCAMAGVHAKNFAKIGYTVFQLVWLLFALIVMFNASWFHWMIPNKLMECPFDVGITDRDVCMGTSIMLRVSFSLLIFHTFVFLFTLMRN